MGVNVTTTVVTGIVTAVDLMTVVALGIAATIMTATTSMGRRIGTLKSVLVTCGSNDAVTEIEALLVTEDEAEVEEVSCLCLLPVHDMVVAKVGGWGHVSF